MSIYKYLMGYPVYETVAHFLSNWKKDVGESDSIP